MHKSKVFTTFARILKNYARTGFVCHWNKVDKYRINRMYWTLELASKLEDAPWPATKEELLDYANRIGAPAEVIENLEELEGDDEEQYESILDLWPDYPTQDEDFFFDEEEY